MWINFPGLEPRKTRSFVDGKFAVDDLLFVSTEKGTTMLIELGTTLSAVRQRWMSSQSL